MRCETTDTGRYQYVIHLGPKAHEIAKRVAERVMDGRVSNGVPAANLVQFLALHALIDLEASLEKICATGKYMKAEGITDQYGYLDDQAEAKSGKLWKKCPKGKLQKILG